MDNANASNGVLAGQAGSLVPAQMLMFWERSSEPWGVKNAELKFIYANRAYLDLLGVDDVLGKRSSDLPLFDFADSFEQQDRLVMDRLDRVTSLEIHRYGGKKSYSAWMFDKYPLLDQNDQISGVVFHGRLARDFGVKTFITGEIPAPLTFEKPTQLLSEKEWGTLFLLLMGKNRKEIAKIHGVSLKTIEQRINNSLTKTLQPTTQQLIQYAIKEGWHRYIPNEFLSECSILL